MKKQKITSATTLAEILKHKEAAKVLEKYKLPCLWCPMASAELSKLTLGQVARAYGLNLKAMLKELNKAYRK